MKIKLTVFLLTIGTLILLLVGCKGFGAINNTIPTLQDDKVILNPVNSENGLNAIDVFINFPGTSEEDRSHLEAMKEIYSQYHYCVSISIKHTQNQDGSIEYEYFFLGTEFELLQYYNKSNVDEADDIISRIIYLWLNGKINKLYDFGEYSDAITRLSKELNSTDDIKQWEQIIQKEEYLFLKEISSLSDGESTIPSDKRGIDNRNIANVLLENYYSYNAGLKDHVDPFYEIFTLKPKLAELYKQYGNAVFGNEIDDVYVISNYNDMYGELDKLVAEEYNLKPEDFR